MRTLISSWITVLFFSFLWVPIAGLAQSGDVRELIRAELMSDPRTANMSSDEINAIIDVLASQPGAEQVFEDDDRDELVQATTFAQAATRDTADEVICPAGDWMCAWSEAFGFVGPDNLIAYILGVSSMALIWLIAVKQHHNL